ncbi:SUMF1/EgtB/PvdO family nonheme iron enzyme, partial [bacterium]|nr:SUMF1/EgtB/PvdO family nonheme iron enzyme [bacterium]
TRSRYDEFAYANPYQPEQPAANAGTTPTQYVVIRGGSWNNQAPVLRTTTRDKVQASAHYDGVGFRLVWYP